MSLNPLRYAASFIKRGTTCGLVECLTTLLVDFLFDITNSDKLCFWENIHQGGISYFGGGDHCIYHKPHDPLYSNSNHPSQIIILLGWERIWYGHTINPFEIHSIQHNCYTIHLALPCIIILVRRFLPVGELSPVVPFQRNFARDHPRGL